MQLIKYALIDVFWTLGMGSGLTFLAIPVTLLTDDVIFCFALWMTPFFLE